MPPDLRAAHEANDRAVLAVLGEPPAITNGRGRPPGGPEKWQNRFYHNCSEA